MSNVFFNTYLVGGAVRDMIMGKTPKDYDYVVVGATPQDMLDMGFTQVGADFPVFLKHGEEYALARTERKSGKGYKGFEVSFDPTVTLEEDLKRRDLTINAIARHTATGDIVDPYGGRKDIKNRVLRHVSDAFAEDPLRVLRVARFAARYPDFKIAEETWVMLESIVESGELETLTKERVWNELEQAMSTAPGRFFEVLDHIDALYSIFPGRVARMFSTNYKRLMFIQRDVDLKFQRWVNLFHNIDVNTLRDFEKLGPPNEILKIAKFVCDFNKLNAFDIEALLHFIRVNDLWRDSSMLEMMLKLTIIPFKVYVIEDNILAWDVYSEGRDLDGELWGSFLEFFKQASEIGFHSLTEEQQASLKGAEIGKAIDALRTEVFEKWRAQFNLQEFLDENYQELSAENVVFSVDKSMYCL